MEVQYPCFICSVVSGIAVSVGGSVVAVVLVLATSFEVVSIVGVIVGWCSTVLLTFLYAISMRTMEASHHVVSC